MVAIDQAVCWLDAMQRFARATPTDWILCDGFCTAKVADFVRSDIVGDYSIHTHTTEIKRSSDKSLGGKNGRFYCVFEFEFEFDVSGVSLLLWAGTN